MHLIKQKLLAATLICLVIYGTVGTVRKINGRNDGFTIERITSQFDDRPEWDVSLKSSDIDLANHALNQPYFYLAHGFQCFVFTSQDGKYILKFIRHQRLRPHAFFTMLPDLPFIKTFKEEKAAQGRKRAHYLFKSLKVAFDSARDETGLLLVHLNKTKGLFPRVTIYDKVGSQYSIELDTYQFVIQHKAILIKPEISRLMQEGKVDEAKKRIDQIFELLTTCSQKGIADNDQQLIRKNNLGFLADHAIYIDTGKITRKESIKTKKGFEKDLARLDPLYEWLSNTHPELAHFFKDRKAELTE